MGGCAMGGERLRSALRRAAPLLATLITLPLVGGAPPRAGEVPRLFQTSDGCLACHNNLVTSGGEDVSIGTAWRASMMANAGRDPYWQASVRREVNDHPMAQAHIEDECSVCHAPMARAQARAEGGTGEVFAHLPVGQSGSDHAPLLADGVSCTVCHQIQPTNFGDPSSFNGRFVIDLTTAWGARSIFGPHPVDSGRANIMRSASDFLPVEGSHVRQSELCATCHTLYTDALDDSGRVVGRLAEQVPYLEWKQSRYVSTRSCQSCHMPVVAESIAISGVWGLKRAGLARHEFRGGNFFMLEMLNRYRRELGVEALPHEMSAQAAATRAQLQRDVARLQLTSRGVREGQLTIHVDLENHTGHKFPTAYPSRRAWLHLTVTDSAGLVLFESGRLDSSGAIRGNDNDEDAARWERHHDVINDPSQVQVYESVLLDHRGRVTTGLLSAVRYAKDNRLLPEGFDREGAPEDVAVKGVDASDATFDAGRDRVQYVIDVRGARAPFTVRAEFRFQPIGYRWARTLASHDDAETRRFVRMFDSMASRSSTLIAADSLQVR